MVVCQEYIEQRSKDPKGNCYLAWTSERGSYSNLRAIVLYSASAIYYIYFSTFNSCGDFFPPVHIVCLFIVELQHLSLLEEKYVFISLPAFAVAK